MLSLCPSLASEAAGFRRRSLLRAAREVSRSPSAGTATAAFARSITNPYEIATGVWSPPEKMYPNLSDVKEFSKQCAVPSKDMGDKPSPGTASGPSSRSEASISPRTRCQLEVRRGASPTRPTCPTSSDSNFCCERRQASAVDRPDKARRRPVFGPRASPKCDAVPVRHARLRLTRTSAANGCRRPQQADLAQRGVDRCPHHVAAATTKKSSTPIRAIVVHGRLRSAPTRPTRPLSASSTTASNGKKYAP